MESVIYNILFHEVLILSYNQAGPMDPKRLSMLRRFYAREVKSSGQGTEIAKKRLVKSDYNFDIISHDFCTFLYELLGFHINDY